MIQIRSLSVVAVAALAMGIVLWPAQAPAQQLNAVEKYYVELAKLPPAERAMKLLEAAKKEGEVNVVRGFGSKEGKAGLKMFQDRHPGFKLKYIIRSSSAVAESFLQEEAAGKHLTDVAEISTPDLGLIMARDLAAENPSPMAARILPQYRGFMDPTGKNRWIPWYSTTHGIGYNPNLLKASDAPQSWMDLCNPKYKGQNSFEPVETRMLIGLYYIFDKDLEKVRTFMECLGKNEPILMKGHTTRTMLLLAGDHALSADSLIYRGIFENKKNPKKAPFRVAFDAPVFMDASGIVINKHTKNPNAAAVYADWLLGDENQNYMYSKLREGLAVKHPFFPDNVKLVTTLYIDAKTTDTLHDMWKKYLGSKR